MTDLELAQVIDEIYKRLEPAGPDFTTKTLGALIGIDYKEISRVASQGRVHGSYKVGGRWRFRRAEVMFYRAVGQDIFKKGCRR